jgi:DNA processing protein
LFSGTIGISIYTMLDVFRIIRIAIGGSIKQDSDLPFQMKRMMEPPVEHRISTVGPEELLGPLNDVETKYAPEKLFTSGPMEHPLPRPRVAIIGSRKASKSALDLAATIARTLVKRRVVIVSGLAEGVDTAGHRSAIESGGRTIAVLGTPLNQVYPKKNAQLQDEIMAKHVAISQFPIGYPVQPRNFVLRNRTMALIANASIIVEAGETSGSLHQGWEALRLGRPLFIWTDLVNSSLNWPKRMVRYGALELKSPEQLLDILPSPERILIKIAR